MSFDTGRKNELKKDEETLKRKIDQGIADSGGIYLDTYLH